MMFQKFIDDPSRSIVVGGPDDAESVGWARHVAMHNGIPWYGLPRASKDEMVSREFVDAIVSELKSDR